MEIRGRAGLQLLRPLRAGPGSGPPRCLRHRPWSRLSLAGRTPRGCCGLRAEPQNLRLKPGPAAEAPWFVVVRWKPVSFRSSSPWGASGTVGPWSGQPRLGEPPQHLPSSASPAPHQLAVAQASLWGSWARATLHPLLLTLGGPRGEHRGVDGEGGLSEILMLEAVLCTDSPPREVGQEPGGTRALGTQHGGGRGHGGGRPAGSHTCS